MNVAYDLSALPPMLTQYVEYKSQYPDCLLLFQVGDFYEVFFEDAVTVSRTLNLTLTSRDRDRPNPIPMAGVPVAVVDNYIERLVAAKFSVALVSQVVGGNPNARSGMARKLERIITPGIRVLGSVGGDGAVAFVSAIGLDSNHNAAIAFASVERGEILVRENISHENLMTELGQIGPAEIILPRSVDTKPLDKRTPWVKEIEERFGNAGLKFRAEPGSQTALGSRNLAELPGYAALGILAKRAVRQLLSFIDETTVSRQVPISRVKPERYENVLSIDATARFNLELVQNTRDASNHGSLFWFLDVTQSIGGKRLLRNWILNPRTDIATVLERLTAVRLLKQFQSERAAIKLGLQRLPDLERIAARIELGIVSPRELGALRDGMHELPKLRELVGATNQTADFSQSSLKTLEPGLQSPENLTRLLDAALQDQLPQTIREGEIFRETYNLEIDKLRKIKQKGRSWIVELEALEREKTGITSLKIKFNNIIGYFFEVTKANLEKVPVHYIRKQSTTLGDRFTTPELREREAALLGAEAKLITLEEKLFFELRQTLLPYAASIRALGDITASLDVLTSFAEISERENLVEPEMHSGHEIDLEGASHPIIARFLEGRFIANAVRLDQAEKNCLIITGPNMGGKSTYLRQTALAVIMAQIGCFVAAKRARIGMVDKIFARLGAADNLFEGDSTFMVEMREAAHIISSATDRSLLLIDEIGRGTATLDGLALAQAILEWIVLKVKARTLFATHFHELTALADIHPAIFNLSVGSVDRDGEVFFTHEIKPGAANKSYGLEVARLAGLPGPLLQRARELFAEHAEAGAKDEVSDQRQTSLFDPKLLKPRRKTRDISSSDEVFPTAAPADPNQAAKTEIIKALSEIDCNNITPLEALSFLAKTQEAAKKLP